MDQQSDQSPSFFGKVMRRLRFEAVVGSSALLHLGPAAVFECRKIRKHTLCPAARLASLIDLAVQVERRRVPGDFVECGVWRGGCAGLMGYVSKLHGSHRRVHLFDSFEGLPAPRADQDGVSATELASGRGDGSLQSIGVCVGTVADVESLLFEDLGLRRQDCAFHVGWFQDTVPSDAAGIEAIALLRLDGDWYDSTKVCLDNLYDRVSPGGYIVIDDYGYWEGCRKAVDEFIASRGLHVSLENVDGWCVFFQKPLE